MEKILHLCQILRQPDSIHAPGLCILFKHYKGVPINFNWRGPGSGEGVPPPHWGGDWGPEFFFKSKLVSRSQLRRPRHEEQRQSNVRSNTEAITGEAMSSQDLKSTRFAVSANHSTYVL